MAAATPGDRFGLPWEAFRTDYSEIRRRIAHVVPGCEAYDEKVDRPGGFTLPHPPRDTRTFGTRSGRAVFSVNPIDVLHVPPGRLLLQTLRSRDQFNTTIYRLDDRYRGVSGGRRVVFVHADDIVALGLHVDQYVDLVSEWTDGSERTAPAFRVIAYEQPRGCAAAYYPETNPSVPLESTAESSNCPTSKAVVVRLDPTGRHPGSVDGTEEVIGRSGGGAGSQGDDEGHKSRPRPTHLSRAGPRPGSRPPTRLTSSGDGFLPATTQEAAAAGGQRGDDLPGPRSAETAATSPARDLRPYEWDGAHA